MRRLNSVQSGAGVARAFEVHPSDLYRGCPKAHALPWTFYPHLCPNTIGLAIATDDTRGSHTVLQ